MKEERVPVLFLDRDGTINIDMGQEYLNTPSKAKLISGAGIAIDHAKKAGFKIAIVTNQAGVAKGKTSKDALPAIHKRLAELIATEAGIKDFDFDDIRICMHHPDDKCKCRKPETGMLEAAIKALNADVSRSYFVGDKISDLQCAARMGMAHILVLTGHGLETQAELKETPGLRPAGIVPSLMEAVELAIRLKE